MRACVLLLLTLCLPATATSAPQGNVLLVVADDVGADKLAAFGARSAPSTPTLDALAAGGVRFASCWANPVCSTTRATIQTGRYSFRTGVGSVVPFCPELPLAETTIPEALDAASGGTIAHAAFGKWHLGGNTQTPFGQLNPNLHGWGHFSGLLVGAFTSGFAYDLWPKTVDGSTALTTAYATSDNVDDALSWIAQQQGSWLCYLSFNAAHTPLHVPPAGLYSTQPPAVDPCLAPAAHYAAMLEALDHELGRLLASLDPALLAATTVVFVGDNGTDPLVSDPQVPAERGKGSLYQGGLVVPLIVQGPAVVAPGRQVGALVNTSDLFATALELAGVTPPGGTDSVSLVPYLVDPAQSALRAFTFAEVFTPPPASAPAAPGRAAGAHALFESECGFGGVFTQGRAIRDGIFKLIRHDDGGEEFYNLVLDPDEQVDLLQGPPLGAFAAAHLAWLRARLDELLAS